MTRTQPLTDMPGIAWKRDVDAFIEAHPEDVLGLMLSINEAFGFLPRNALAYVAARCDVPLVRLVGIASFYRTFRLEPRGVHTVAVCRGTACHVAGGGSLLTYLENALETKVGQTSADGQVTLESVACVGCCSLAPVVQIDGQVKGRTQAKDIQELVGRLRSAAVGAQ